MSFFIRDLRELKQDVCDAIDREELDTEPIAVLERYARMKRGGLTSYVEKLVKSNNKDRAKKLLDAISDDMLQPWLYWLLTPIRVLIRIGSGIWKLVR